jgi:hypothetical protein
MNVKEVLDLLKNRRYCSFIIEQESYQGKTLLECVEQDLQIIKKWGY